MCRFCVNSALKSRHSQRVELRASCKVMTCYFSCALTELISRYTALEIRLEQFQYQQSFSPAPTAAAGEENRYKNPHKNRSPNDATDCVYVHSTGF